MSLSREDAWKLMTEYTQGESLRKHMMAVEAAVRGYARQFGEDEDDWGAVALLPDFDYERYPDQENPPYRGVEAASVRKGMKDKAFARGVNGGGLGRGAEELGIPLDQHITNVIAFMRAQAEALGLRGNL